MPNKTKTGCTTQGQINPFVKKRESGYGFALRILAGIQRSVIIALPFSGMESQKVKFLFAVRVLFYSWLFYFALLVGAFWIYVEHFYSPETAPEVLVGKITNKIKNSVVIPPDLVAEKSETLDGERLLHRLRMGGYIIFFRHFHTNFKVIGEDKTTHRKKNLTLGYFKDCEMQRPLSKYGLLQAESIGTAFKKLRIPVGKILSSPYCRNREGIERMFQRQPELDIKLIYRKLDYSSKEMNQHMAELLDDIPAPGTNTVISAHRTQMDDIARIEEGEAFVFQPISKNRFRWVGKITPEEWGLAASHHPTFLGQHAVLVEKYGSQP